MSADPSTLRSDLEQLEREMRAEVLRTRQYRSGPANVTLIVEWANKVAAILAVHPEPPTSNWRHTATCAVWGWAGVDHETPPCTCGAPEANDL